MSFSRYDEHGARTIGARRTTHYATGMLTILPWYLAVDLKVWPLLPEMVESGLE